jgi:hypothetical protein
VMVLMMMMMMMMMMRMMMMMMMMMMMTMADSLYALQILHSPYISDSHCVTLGW